MRTSLIASLLAATLLVPAGAYAQNGPRIGRQTDDDTDRPQRPDRPDRPGLVEGEDRIDRGERTRAERPQPQPGGWQRGGDRRGLDFAGGQRRPDRDGDNRSDWRDRPDGPGNGQDRSDSGRPGWNRGNPNRGDADWRDGDHDGTPNWRDRDDQPRDWNRGNDRQDRRGNSYDRGGYGNRGSWNRDWRHDNRYNWNGYRSSNRGIYRLPRYYPPRGLGHGYRRFSIGLRLDSGLFGSSYWIDEPYYYRLPPAYGPYRWVRYYGDALLVDVRSGYVVDVVYGIFW